jgi:hypothetical protein
LKSLGALDLTNRERDSLCTLADDTVTTVARHCYAERFFVFG